MVAKTNAISPTASVKTASVSATASTVEQLIHKYFAPADWQTAEAICMAESGCISKRGNKANYNGTYDWGIFQINDIHRNRVSGNVAQFLDPETNVRIAAQIKAESGWHAWSTYNNGRYKQYLQ